MTLPRSLKAATLVSVTAASTMLMIQACGGDAVAEDAPDPIEGVWETAASQRDCSTGAVLSTFRSAQVFHRGGTMGDTSSHGPGTRGPAYGVWARSGSGRSGGDYSVKFRFFRYAADGSVAGSTVATVTVTLAADGNGFTATRSSQVLDNAGNPVATVCATDVATRLR